MTVNDQPTDSTERNVEQQLRSTIRFKQESEAFLLGIIAGAGAVLLLTTVQEVLVR